MLRKCSKLTCISVSWIALFVISVSAFPRSAYSQTQIFNAQQLSDIRNNLGGDYILMADIDLQNSGFTPIGDAFNRFTGSINGNGKVIRNFTYLSNGVTPVGIPTPTGLFAMAQGATFNDVVLDNVVVSGGDQVGCLLGYAQQCTIADCEVNSYNSSSEGNTDIGGLVGRAEDTSIDNCRSYASSHCEVLYSGGLVGHLHVANVVTNCRSYGDATGGPNAEDIGAFCGNVHGSVVEDSFAFGDASGDYRVGGFSGKTQLAGGQDVRFERCFAYGEVTCTSSEAGGFVGFCAPSDLLDCRAFGKVTVTTGTSGSSLAEPGHKLAAAGGLVGRFEYAEGILFASRVHDSSAHGKVVAVGQMVGGLIGLAHGVDTSRSYAVGDVTANDRFTGGLIGSMYTTGAGGLYQSSKIVDSFAIGDAVQTGTGANSGMVGGLVGYMDHGAGIVLRAYSSGFVSGNGSGIGGLVGQQDPANAVLQSYWDTQISGQTTSDGGTGKTTVQMMQPSTFIGWNFGSVWTIAVGVTSPYLQ